MGNLFIVFTPFQLFVAQQIVRQEKLRKNILIKGWVSGNNHFLDIYDVMIMDGYWDKEIVFPEISQIEGLRTHSLLDIKTAQNNFIRLKRIVKDNSISSIYLGEIYNQSLRFISLTFSHLGKKIVWFEEGSTHYVERAYVPDMSFSKKMKVLFRDILYYLPLYHVRFAKWRYNPGCPPSGLPMDGRYSIVPGYHNESFDKELKIESLFSEKTRKYIEQEITTEDDRTLFVSQPREGELEKYCMKVIEEFFSSFDKKIKLYIKFHPRERKDAKERIIRILSSIGINYCIISEDISIPIEYYLQSFKFDEIILFDSSTYFYNGYVYPKTKIRSLLPMLYSMCKNKHVGDLELMRNYMNKMKIVIPQ